MERNPLLPLIEKQVREDPKATVRLIEGLTDQEATEVLRSLPPKMAAQLLSLLQVSFAAGLVKSIDPESFKELVSLLPPDHGAALFMHLPPESRDAFLGHLTGKVKRLIQEHLTYPEGSLGRVMTRQFLAFRKTTKVQDVIRRLRSQKEDHLPLSYVYVVDNERHLEGVINMHGLLLADGERTLESAMQREAFALNAFTDLENAAAEMSRRRFFAAPVVDGENRILGIVKAERLLHDVKDESGEDLQRMFGAGANEWAFAPFRFSLKKRLPWLYVNLATAFMAGAVVGLFEGLIGRLSFLAVFLPVVAGQGGNAGAQSMAVVLRGLVMREIPKAKVKPLILKESLLGLSTGLLTGVVAGAVAALWFHNLSLGLVVAMGMLVCLFFAGLAGASIPIVMKALGFDPAQCSNIILTTVTDIIGFFAFLGFAILLEGHLSA